MNGENLLYKATITVVPLLNSLFSPLKAAFPALVFTARKKGHRFCT